MANLAAAGNSNWTNYYDSGEPTVPQLVADGLGFAGLDNDATVGYYMSDIAGPIPTLLAGSPAAVIACGGTNDLAHAWEQADQESAFGAALENMISGAPPASLTSARPSRARS